MLLCSCWSILAQSIVAALKRLTKDDWQEDLPTNYKNENEYEYRFKRVNRPIEIKR